MTTGEFTRTHYLNLDGPCPMCVHNTNITNGYCTLYHDIGGMTYEDYDYSEKYTTDRLFIRNEACTYYDLFVWPKERDANVTRRTHWLVPK